MRPPRLDTLIVWTALALTSGALFLSRRRHVRGLRASTALDASTLLVPCAALALSWLGLVLEVHPTVQLNGIHALDAWHFGMRAWPLLLLLLLASGGTSLGLWFVRVDRPPEPGDLKVEIRGTLLLGLNALALHVWMQNIPSV